MNTTKTTLLSIIFSLALLPAVLPGKSYAQVCEATREVIVTLLLPRFGFPTLWDANYHDRDAMVQMASGVPLEGGTVMTVGRKLDKEDHHAKETYLAELNRRGRAVNEKFYAAKAGEQPVKVIAFGERYIVVSNMVAGARKEQQQMRVTWYDKDLALKREKIIKSDTYNYRATSLIPALDGKGFIVVAHAFQRDENGEKNGLLIRMNAKGDIQWKRAYRPGIPNQIVTLTPYDEDSYIAAGEIRQEDGRMGGWVLHLGHDGTILWQRTYPRGKAAKLTMGAPFPLLGEKAAAGMKDNIILTGQTTPLDDTPPAAWLMALDPTGEVLWQRYYRHDDFVFDGKAVQAEKDGRINMVMNAFALEDSDQRDHIRLLTFSPRGVMLQDESYITGRQATATDFFSGGNGERIVTAIIEDDAQPPPIETILNEEEGDASGSAAESEEQDEPEEETEAAPEEEPPVHEGWLFVGVPLDLYEDPCHKKKRF